MGYRVFLIRIDDEGDPFDELATLLMNKSIIKSKYDISIYPQEHVFNAIKQLSKSQSAIKSMDGATHKIGNTFKDK